MSKRIHFKESDYGFEYGSMSICRIHSDAKSGVSVVRISTPKVKDLQIYATKTGKVRVWLNGEEMTSKS